MDPERPPGPGSGPGPPSPPPSGLQVQPSPHIAPHTLPKSITTGDLMQRSPSGKPDYKWATKVLTAAEAATV